MEKKLIQNITECSVEKKGNGDIWKFAETASATVSTWPQWMDSFSKVDLSGSLNSSKKDIKPKNK